MIASSILDVKAGRKARVSNGIACLLGVDSRCGFVRAMHVAGVEDRKTEAGI
jgi:hypothetical protein